MEWQPRTVRQNENEVTLAGNKSWYLVSYDVHDERRLRRVAKHLEGYGARIQYSVFRCRLSVREIERLKWELTKIMDRTDDLLIVGLCEKCADRVIMRNNSERWSDSIVTYEVI